jgi:DNA-binding SARP family transcriptional activator
MFLKTLGGLSVEVDGAPGCGAGHQRKTLALLAVLAAAGRRGVSRDKVMAYLWPESDAEHARSLLKQACYALRRDLHTHDLFLGTTELSLNPDAITSDVEQFKTGLEQRDAAGAVCSYGGAFLDGFYLSDAPEFEQWVERERAWLRSRACEALESLAISAVGRGDHRGAVEYWRRLSSLDPHNSRVTLGLMRALAARGDPAGALEVADAHEALLREELDLGPDQSVMVSAEHLRTQRMARRPAAHRRQTEAQPAHKPRVAQGQRGEPMSLSGSAPVDKVVLAATVAGLIAAALLWSSNRR